MRVTVLAPVNQPRQGYVVYYDTRRAAARRRLDKTLALLRSDRVPATGVVVETDPVSALRDAIDQLEPDEIIVSTHPQQKSGWLRRNAVDQMRRVAGELPFEHVVVDLDGGARRGERARRREPDGARGAAPRHDPRARRDVTGELPHHLAAGRGRGKLRGGGEAPAPRRVTLLRSEGLDVHGQISHPDPYAAVMQTLEDERVDEIIVSTFPGARSGLAAPRPARASARRHEAARSSTSRSTCRWR